MTIHIYICKGEITKLQWFVKFVCLSNFTHSCTRHICCLTTNSLKVHDKNSDQKLKFDDYFPKNNKLKIIKKKSNPIFV